MENMSDPRQLLGRSSCFSPSTASFQEIWNDCFDGDTCNQSQFKLQNKRNGEENMSSSVENTRTGFNPSKHNYFLWEIRNSDFFLERISFDELTV